VTVDTETWRKAEALGLRKRNFRTRVTRCYELSYQYLFDSDIAAQWLLVHGEAEGRNGRIDHAWLERDGTVYDATTDRLYSFAEYETLFRAAVRVRYTVKEAARRVVESGHYGPWSDTD
jgi:hypothetical protein